jgi:EAL domain-containing protein (putative c-di-GMP-specific phosphodiesterase class I)
MYRAKARGKNRYEFFSADMALSPAIALKLEPVLRSALEQRRLRLHYQPQFTMTGELAGFEALLRLEHPRAGLLCPGDFLGQAEEIGMIHSIGEWVLHEVCLQIHRWRDGRLDVPKLSVNISPVQFASKPFAASVGSILREMRIEPENIELEIPESCILSDLHESMEQLHSLKALGVRLAADHFGLGPTSLTAMHRLPAYALNCLKIGRAFTDAVDAPVSTLPLVNAMCLLASDLGLTTALTGIERATQFHRLVGVPHGSVQGHFLARPESAEVITHQLRHDSWGWQALEPGRFV